MEAAAIGQAEARTIVRVHRTAMAVIARFACLGQAQQQHQVLKFTRLRKFEII